MKYIDSLNESKEWDNCLSLINSDDTEYVINGLSLAINFQKEFEREYMCTIEEYTQVYNWMELYQIKHINPITDIIELNLQHKKITELPKSISILQKLARLNVSNNLNFITDNIKYCKKIYRLNISNCNISDISVIDNLINLEHLYINDNNITSIDNIKNCTNLCIINAENNKIKTLPDAIEKLYYLNTLYLKSNIIETLPESLGKLKFLNMLDLQDNKLTDLPDTLSKCLSLKTLLLLNNNLTDFPKCLHKINILKSFNADRIVRKNQPAEFKKLKFNGY